MRGRKILVIVGYGAFALVSLVFGLYLTFPADAVGQRLAQEVSKASQGSVTVSFDSVSPYRLSGIAAEGVRIRMAQAGEQPREIKLKAVRARLRLLPLLWLSTSLDAVVDTGGGTVAARFTPHSDKGFFASLAFDDFDLGEPPALAPLLGVQLGGVLNGEISAEWSPDPRKSVGKGALKLAGALVEGAVQGVTIPRVGVGDIALELALDTGRMRVASFTQKGGDIEVRLSGSSAVRPEFAQSSLEACVELRPEAKFLDRDPKMRAAAQLAEVRLRKSPEGFLSVPLSGTLGSPRLRYGLCHAGGRE